MLYYMFSMTTNIRTNDIIIIRFGYTITENSMRASEGIQNVTKARTVNQMEIFGYKIHANCT